MFCDDKNRTKLYARGYWFGLYKLLASRYAATMWYDDNPSTYRDWAVGEPDTNAMCVRYTRGGFRDMWCYQQYHYTCKRPAGKSMLVLDD